MERAFRDRAEAGRMLADELSHLAGRDDVVVLALPRGGVPVAYEIATALGAPLDVFVVRKLGVPGQEELAMGAIASGGARVLNEDVVQGLSIDDDALQAVVASEEAELERRERAYGSGRAVEAAGRTVVLVDDGLATGATMRAAVAAVRQLEPERIVVAVPVGGASTCERLAAEADEVVCLMKPEPMSAISVFYRHFEQTSDDEVRDLVGRVER